MSDTVIIDHILEPLVDKHGLLHIVTALELLCGEKAAHIEMDWQDKPLAREWDRATNALGIAARKIADLSI